jgi:hypothetical protein
LFIAPNNDNLTPLRLMLECDASITLVLFLVEFHIYCGILVNALLIEDNIQGVFLC